MPKPARGEVNCSNLVLLMTLMVGELDGEVSKTITGTERYSKKIVSTLRHDGYLSSIKRNNLLTYRLTALGRKKLSDEFPELKDMIESSAMHDENRDTGRLRYAKVSEALALMHHAGAAVLHIHKPTPFVRNASGEYIGNPAIRKHVIENLRAVYYTTREYKSVFGEEQKGSRNCGIYITSSEAILCYPISHDSAFWSEARERRMVAALKEYVSQIGFEAAPKDVNAIMIGELNHQIQSLMADTITGGGISSSLFKEIYLLEKNGLESNLALYLMLDKKMRRQMREAIFERDKIMPPKRNGTDGDFQGYPVIVFDVFETRKLYNLRILQKERAMPYVYCFPAHEELIKKHIGESCIIRHLDISSYQQEQEKRKAELIRSVRR